MKGLIKTNKVVGRKLYGRFNKVVDRELHGSIRIDKVVCKELHERFN